MLLKVRDYNKKQAINLFVKYVHSISDEDRCFFTTKGRDYKGRHSITEEGEKCVPWVWFEHADYKYEDHKFVDQSAENASSYCRNPDNSERLWCYTSDQGTWGWCDLTMCCKCIKIRF